MRDCKQNRVERLGNERLLTELSRNTIYIYLYVKLHDSLLACTVALAIVGVTQPLENTFFYQNKLVSLPDWRIIVLRTKWRCFVKFFTNILPVIDWTTWTSLWDEIINSISFFKPFHVIKCFIHCFLNQSVLWVLRFVLMKKNVRCVVFRSCSFI